LDIVPYRIDLVGQIGVVSDLARARAHSRSPIVNLALDAILGVAITLLQLAFELLAASINGGEVIVREAPPLLLGVALQTLPIAFDSVPII
jgi:hypothetical protein